ncbi:hypothetical protein P4123_16530 [Pseudomonas aeruginosa]|nr:hypothetical protein [Pseudomonas aeruginosa]
MHTLASQHGGIWVSLGLAPANTSASSRADINNLGASVGALVQSPSDADAQAIPSGDLETVKLYAARASPGSDNSCTPEPGADESPAHPARVA